LVFWKRDRGDMGKKNTGERTCMGCGRKEHKSELLRFVVDEEGNILFDRRQRAPGRGGYLCRREACLAEAVKKRRISVRLRRDVKMDLPSLVQVVQEQLAGDRTGWPR
jgi:predicted RNA-binding protein YlxR (DUF448 family)